MAKKKNEAEKVIVTIPGEFTEAAQKQGADDAHKWFTRLCIDRRISPQELNRRLTESYEQARERMLNYERRLQVKLTTANYFDAIYWRYYHATLSQFIRREEPLKADTKELRDFFESDSSYKKGLKAIENVLLDKHGNFKRGKLNNIATTFLYFNTKKLLKKGSDQFPFSKALAIHFKGSIANGGIGKGAYNEDTAQELERYLQ